jgi:hypothetical protein
MNSTTEHWHYALLAGFGVGHASIPASHEHVRAQNHRPLAHPKLRRLRLGAQVAGLATEQQTSDAPSADQHTSLSLSSVLPVPVLGHMAHHAPRDTLAGHAC